MIGLKPLEAGFDGVHNVAARSSDIIAAGPNTPEHLGCDYDIFARDPQIAQRLPKHLLALAFGVDVCSVEEINPRADGRLYKLIGARLIHCANRFPHSLSA